jgi:hypothetical protein
MKIHRLLLLGMEIILETGLCLEGSKKVVIVFYCVYNKCKARD